MAQFTVYTNENQNSKKLYPFLLDVQHSLLDELDTRLVIPMVKLNNYKQKLIKEINVQVKINGIEYVLLIQQLTAIHKEKIGKAVTSITAKRQEVINGIDFVLSGF
jgi:toxin CcdB